MTMVLRDRMREDIKLAGLAESTGQVYVRHVKRYAEHFCRPPGQMGSVEVRSFLLYLTCTRKLAASTLIVYAAAIAFFYRYTLGRPEVMINIPLPKRKRPSINVPTRDEVRRILDSAHSDFHRTMLLTTYAAGLRRMEVTALRIEDIDSAANLINIQNGKGGKSRVTVLGPALLQELRDHWRRCRPAHRWIFPAKNSKGQWEDRPMPRDSATKAFAIAKKRAGITRRLSLHSLRHACATHMLEDGVDLRTIQVLLGHANIETTTQYAHVATELISRTPSPLEVLKASR